MVDFEVAVLGPVWGYPVLPVFDGASLADQGPDVPYEERLKVVIQASESDFLGDVLDRAARKIGLRPLAAPEGVDVHSDDSIARRLVGVVFYEPGDDDQFQYRPEPWPNVIRLATEDGKPSWPIPWVDIRVDELMNSSRAGLVRGDPTRPYLWPIIPQGEGLQSFIEALWSMWLVWEHVSAGYGTYELLRGIRGRVSRARGRVDEMGSEDARRDRPDDRVVGRPHELLSYLLETERTTIEVAGHLRCSPQRAESLLVGLGLTESRGVWLPSDPDGKLLLRSVFEIEAAGRSPTEARLLELVEETLDDSSS